MSATVLVDHYEDDWGRLWWVSLRGRARVLDAEEEAERMCALCQGGARWDRLRPSSPLTISPRSSAGCRRATKIQTDPLPSSGVSSFSNVSSS